MWHARGTRCKMKIVDKAMHGLTYEHSRCLRPFYYNYYTSIFPLLDFHHYVCKSKRENNVQLTKHNILRFLISTYFASTHPWCLLETVPTYFFRLFPCHNICWWSLPCHIVVRQFLFYILLIHFLRKTINKHLSITCTLIPSLMFL